MCSKGSVATKKLLVIEIKKEFSANLEHDDFFLSFALDELKETFWRINVSLHRRHFGSGNVCSSGQYKD